MAVSKVDQTAWRCDTCDHVERRESWVVIDLVQRPDLRAKLAAGEVHVGLCPECGAPSNRITPLVVIRLSLALPVAVAVPHGMDFEASQEAVGPELAAVRDRLGAEGRDVPGPVLFGPFRAFQVAAERDLGEDMSRVDDLVDDEYRELLVAVVGSAAERAASWASNCVRATNEEDDAVAVMTMFDEPTLRAASDLLRQEAASAPDPATAAFVRNRADLALGLSTGLVDEAWQASQASLSELWTTFHAPEMQAQLSLYEAALKKGDPRQIAATGDGVLEYAERGWPALEARTCDEVATALAQLPDSTPSERERVIVLYERALVLVDADPDVAEAAVLPTLLSNLAAAYGMRLGGDREHNVVESARLLRRALEVVSIDTDGDTWATVQTNLANCLLEQGQVGDALDHLQQALRWRSRERDSRDWAYTQLHLGVAHDRQSRGQPGPDLLAAIDHTHEALEAAEEAGDEVLAGHALHNLASQKLRMAQTGKAPSAEGAALLVEAESHAVRGLQLRPPDSAPDLGGRALKTLAEIQAAQGNRAEAMTSLESALTFLVQGGAPDEARGAARMLASLAEQDGDWPRATSAWSVAVHMAETAFNARDSPDGRLQEVHEEANIPRFAAYAFARQGDLLQALQVVEAGRARELTGRAGSELVDTARLELLDPDIHGRLTEALGEAALQRSVMTEPGTASASPDPHRLERLNAVIDEVRSLPGFEGAFARPDVSAITDAVTSENPLVYLLTAPAGSGALIVWSGTRVEFVAHSALSSEDIVREMLGGAAPQWTGSGYLQALEDVDHLDNAIVRAAELVAPILLKPLTESLVQGGALRCTLVPTGLLGLLPLHALAWTDGDDSVCMLDAITVSYVPCGALHAIGRVRAAGRSTRSRRLLAVGNPHSDAGLLDWAETEVAAVAEALADLPTTVLIGRDATKDAVLANLSDASHVHFACHGGSAVFEDRLTAALCLDGPTQLSALEILDERIQADLVVASACETAVIQDLQAPDESFGIVSAFLSAGASNVVASLWSVSDFATAVLMMKFYELLAAQDIPLSDPPTALRLAQLWVRDLTDGEASAYVASRAALRGKRGVDWSVSAHQSRPFSAPSLWAAFTANG